MYNDNLFCPRQCSRCVSENIPYAKSSRVLTFQSQFFSFFCVVNTRPRPKASPRSEHNIKTNETY